MYSVSLSLFLLVALVALYFAARQRAVNFCHDGAVRFRLHSLPLYYGVLATLWAGIPAIIVLCLWFAFEHALIEYLVLRQLPVDVLSQSPDQLRLVLDQITNIADGYPIGYASDFMLVAADHMVDLHTFSVRVKTALTLLVMAVGAAAIWSKIRPQLRARVQVEQWFSGALLGCSTIVLVIAIGIVFSIAMQALLFFSAVDVLEFFTGSQWAPSAVRSESDVADGYFGMLPLFAGTFLVAAIALCLALPVGLLSAIYLVEFARPGWRHIIKPSLDVLAGIPTVVYGFFAAMTIAPGVHVLAMSLGVQVASTESALAAGLVVGLMIIPLFTSMMADVLGAVPHSLREAANALGSTPTEVVFRVVLPAAFPGLLGCALFATARAIGETMVALMALGLLARLTLNPLASVTTVTKQIVGLLEGEYGFDSPETLAAFALGMLLLGLTLMLNYVAFRVLRHYKEVYEHRVH